MFYALVSFSHQPRQYAPLLIGDKGKQEEKHFFSNFNWFLKCFLPSRLIRLPLVSWRNVSVSSGCRWYRHWSWYRVRISKTTTLMWDEALSSETTLTPFNKLLKLAVSQGPLVPSNDITPIWSWVMALWSLCKLEVSSDCCLYHFLCRLCCLQKVTGTAHWRDDRFHSSQCAYKTSMICEKQTLRVGKKIHW